MVNPPPIKGYRRILEDCVGGVRRSFWLPAAERHIFWLYGNIEFYLMEDWFDICVCCQFVGGCTRVNVKRHF